MKPARSFLFFILYSLFFILFFVQPIHAQAINPYTAPVTNLDVPQNLHTYSQTVFIEVLSAVTCQIAGIDPVNPHQKCLGIDPQSGRIGFIEGGGGAIGLAQKMIALTFTPPVHTGDYVNYLANNFGVVKKVHAQGSGFRSLAPLFNLWSAFRNIVYLFFVIVFVVIGLAIMLRVKIDPRTVMSIENQIPKIIIGLVLVTFSFAIAGLLIDFMWIAIYVGYQIIASTGIAAVQNLNPVLLQGKVPFDAIGVGEIHKIATTVASATKEVIKQVLGISSLSPHNIIPIGIDPLKSPYITIGINPFDGKNLINWLIDAVSLATSISMGANFANMVQGIPFASAPVGIAGGTAVYIATETFLREGLPLILVYIIIFVSLLWALFRLWFVLITAYVYVLLDVTLAPFWILAGLFPGSPAGFGAWFRDIVANLSAFPVTIGMFLLGKVFMEGVKGGGDKFVPPLIGSGYSTDLLSVLIGLGVVLLTPQVVAIIKDAIKAPQFKYTAAIGQAVGVGPAVVGGVTTAVASPYGALSQFRSLRGIVEGKRNLGEALGALIAPQRTEVAHPPKTESHG